MAGVLNMVKAEKYLLWVLKPYHMWIWYPYNDILGLTFFFFTTIHLYKKGKPLQFGEIHLIVINNNFSLSLVAKHRWIMSTSNTVAPPRFEPEKYASWQKEIKFWEMVTSVLQHVKDWCSRDSLPKENTGTSWRLLVCTRDCLKSSDSYILYLCYHY